MQQLEAYLSTLRPNSRRPYRQAFHEFQKFLKENELWLNEYGMQKYLMWLKSKGLAGNTINVKFNALSSIYGHLYEIRHIPKNPFKNAKILTPRKNWNRKRHYKLIPFQKVMMLCDRPSNHTREGIRDRAMLAILLGCGLRKSELLGLRMSDIRRTEGGVRFLYLRDTKSREDANQAIPEWVLERLERHLEIRRYETFSPMSHLFTRYDNDGKVVIGQIPTRTFDRLFKKLCNECGLRDYSPHSTRKTAITKLVDDGATLYEARDFARHASVLTTEKYYHRENSVEKGRAKNLQY